MSDARQIGKEIGIEWEDTVFTISQFQKGLYFEIENHKDPVIVDTEAGKIALANLMEDITHYDKEEKAGPGTLITLPEIDAAFEKKYGKPPTITTKEDLQGLLEATPESARDRLRRRSSHTQDTVRSHQDTETGHSKLKPPEFNKRVKPKREREDRTQMQHAGKMGHRHSARKQLGEPKRFTEAMNFLHENIGKPFGDELLSEIEDKQALHIVATKLMGHAGINRDWLSDLCNILDNE